MSVCWIEVSVQSGRSCNRPALFIVRRREAAAETLPNIPSGCCCCCCVLLMQPCRCRFIALNAVALKQKKIGLNIQITHFNIRDKLKFRGLCFKLPLSAI